MGPGPFPVPESGLPLAVGSSVLTRLLTVFRGLFPVLAGVGAVGLGLHPVESGGLALLAGFVAALRRALPRGRQVRSVSRGPVPVPATEQTVDC
jgi:hypothetical protein